MDMLERVNWMAAAAGLAGQYAAESIVGGEVALGTGLDRKMITSATVGAATGFMTGSVMVGVGAGAIDYGLCMLYEQYPALDVLSPVRGGIASATAQMFL